MEGSQPILPQEAAVSPPETSISNAPLMRLVSDSMSSFSVRSNTPTPSTPPKANGSSPSFPMNPPPFDPVSASRASRATPPFSSHANVPLSPQPPTPTNIPKSPSTPVPTNVPVSPSTPTQTNIPKSPSTPTPTIVLNTPTQLEYKEALDSVKRRLKRVSEFVPATVELASLLKKHLAAANKQQFYGALYSVSFLAGKHGYDLSAMKTLYDVALSEDCVSKWSSGFLYNIREWHKIVSEMIAGTFDKSSYKRNDGRFGTNVVRSPRPTPVPSQSSLPSTVRPIQLGTSPYRYTQTLNHSNPFLSLLFGDRFGAFEDDDSSSSEESEDERPYPFLRFKTIYPEILDYCKVRHSPNPISESFEFNINEEQMKEIQEKQYEVHLVCCTSKGYNLVPGKSPDYLRYRVNEKPVKLNAAGKEIQFGYDITPLCVANKNILKITTLQCCCNMKFGIRLVIPMINNLMESVKSRTLNKEQSLAKIKESFSNQGDIVELHITLALLCPLGQMFIETPVRGKNCKHIQCFDLETFLLMNKADPTWSCPVCNDAIHIDSLIVDEYMMEILKTIGDDDIAESIKMDENGDWELFKIEFGDHSESEDEDLPPKNNDKNDTLTQKRARPSDLPQAQPPAKIMRTLAPPPRPIVIDLTL